MDTKWTRIEHSNYPKDKVLLVVEMLGHFPATLVFWRCGHGLCRLDGSTLDWNPTHYIVIPKLTPDA